MQYGELGRTGLEVSRLSFGTAPLGGLFGAVDEPTAIRVVHEVLDLGITFIDSSPYYGNAEERLGKALRGKRDQVVLGTKAGRYGPDDFDFSPSRIRRSLQQSLTLLGTDHVDLLQLHDIEFVDLDPLLTDSVAELLTLRDEGLCRAVGMTGYPLAALRRVITESDVDVVLSYAHATLLDDSLQSDLLPVARHRGVGVINAAAVALGLLTPAGSSMGADHPAAAPIRAAAEAMIALCAEHGMDISFLANQYAIQRSGCPTTLIGTARSHHLRAAVEAVDTPIDDELLDAVSALRPPVGDRSWTSGLPQNN